MPRRSAAGLTLRFEKSGRDVALSRPRADPGQGLAYDTRQIRPPPSSETRMDPSGICSIPTGRPHARGSSAQQPARHKIFGPGKRFTVFKGNEANFIARGFVSVQGSISSASMTCSHPTPSYAPRSFHPRGAQQGPSLALAFYLCPAVFFVAAFRRNYDSCLNHTVRDRDNKHGG